MNLRKSLFLAAFCSSAVAVPALADTPRAAAQSPKMLEPVVYFDYDSSSIDEAGRQSLDRVADWLRSNPSRVLVIAGHTDEVGTEDYNETLGRSRAQAAKRYLEDQGIRPTRVFVVSRGEDFADNSKPDKYERFTVFMSNRLPNRDQPTRQANTPPAANRYAAPDRSADVHVTHVNPVIDTPAPRVKVVEVPAQGAPTDHIVSDIGIAVGVGGGVQGFLDQETSAMTETGGAWDARVTVGTRSYIAAEAAYIGSAQDVNGMPFVGDAALVGNGVEGNLRLNLIPDQRVQPYVFGGIGYTHYEITGQDIQTMGMEDDEDILHVPAGAGLSVRGEGIVFDLRTTFRAAFQDDMFSNTGPDADMSTWGASGRVAWEF